MAIQELWKGEETCILDVCVINTDTKAYRSLSLRSVLESAARMKKPKYLKACPEQCRTSVSLAYSANDMAGTKARAFEKHCASLLVVRTKCEYSELVGFVSAQMTLLVVRANTFLLCGR